MECMATPRQGLDARDRANWAFPRMFVRDAFHNLRPDLLPEAVDELVEQAIASVMAYRADLPADAYLA